MQFIVTFIISITTSIVPTKCEIISTSLGKLEGKQIDEFHLCKKIPFAKPPLGELRFQKPEMAEKWNGVLNATEYGPACLSNSTISKSNPKFMNEDCLHLNIFTSDYCLKSQNCPVVFYIHGGSLAYDSAVMLNDTHILQAFVSRDIIFVIPAFRLGIFSHFVVEDQSIAPSNLALYDILLALEFVNAEIRNFGGDSNKVTLMGHSYGASVVSAMVFSTEINKDLSLFQQAISMSSNVDFESVETQMERTRKFVSLSKCNSMKCLQNEDALELLRIQRYLEESEGVEFANLILREPLFQNTTNRNFMKTPKNVTMLTGCTLMELDSYNVDAPIAELFDFQNPEEVTDKYVEDRKTKSEGLY